MEVSRLNSRWIKIGFEGDFSWDKVEAIKRIPNSKFDESKKEWRVGINTKESAARFLSFCNEFEVDVGDDIKRVFSELREQFHEQDKKKEENRRLAEAEKSSIDRIYGTARGLRLREYQRVAVEYVEKNRRVIIGDSPGLGKTISAMGAVQHLDQFPVLCVVPAVVRGNWENEWNKWLPRRVVKNVKSGSHSNFRGSIVVCTYSLIHKFVDRFKEKGFKSIIVDESHFVKNHKARRSKAVYEIAKKIDTRILLTGTPVVSSPIDLVHQLRVLGKLKDEFGGWFEFTGRYCDRKKQFGRWDVTGASNLGELNDRLAGTCYIRRNKMDVLDELPDVQISKVPAKLGNRRCYDKAEHNFVAHLKDKYQDLSRVRRSAKIKRALAAEKLVKMNELRMLAAKEKIKETKKWAESFIENEEPVLIFTNFRDVANQLSEAFGCPKIDGSTKNKTKVVEEFQNGKHDALVINIKAGGVGITLTRSSTVVFASLPWTWADVQQAIARVHRIGQKHKVNAYFMVAENSIDDDMYDILERKKKITDVVNKGKNEEVENVDVQQVTIDKILRRNGIITE